MLKLMIESNERKVLFILFMHVNDKQNETSFSTLSKYYLVSKENKSDITKVVSDVQIQVICVSYFLLSARDFIFHVLQLLPFNFLVTNTISQNAWETRLLMSLLLEAMTMEANVTLYVLRNLKKPKDNI